MGAAVQRGRLLRRHRRTAARRPQRHPRRSRLRRAGTVSAAASWTLPPRSASVPRARHAVRAQLLAWGLPHGSEAAELLVSELVTNAVRHARGLIRLRLSLTGDLLRCEVEDASPDLPHLRTAGHEDESSRGLQLVEALASGWGSSRTRRGKRVWFDLPLPQLAAEDTLTLEAQAC
ncbi:ATP-binding protein [Nonomuraea diastatica]|uniref:ATP-binding protein n=1 Tax=Nonomuraea diastatica TaxID=1848329 RepID=A0A4R4VB28_9ACTN|nr:ATP-binding protein [Nonomuraea diastatica]